MGKSLKKGLSFGVNGVVKDAKALINAKGAGKIIPGLNIAAGAVEVVQGISKSEKQARKDGLKGQEITASKVGGALVDVGKVAVTTAAIGAAGAVAGFFGAPVVVVVGAGMLVGALADFSIKKSKVVDKAKKGVNSLVKGVSGPDFYKKISKKEFKMNSFLLAVGGYGTLITILLIFQLTDTRSIFDNSFSRNLFVGMTGILLINLICIFLFKNKHIQKYLVIVVYLSGVVFLFFMLATVTLLIENSLEVFLKESIVILIGVVIGFLYNLFLVKISLKKQDFSIRDSFANYYMNILGGIGTIILLLSTTIDNTKLLFIGVPFVVISLLCLSFFHFSRVVSYWKKESNIELDKSIYGNSIEIMKKRKNKK